MENPSLAIALSLSDWNTVLQSLEGHYEEYQMIASMSSDKNAANLNAEVEKLNDIIQRIKRSLK